VKKRAPPHRYELRLQLIACSRLAYSQRYSLTVLQCIPEYQNGQIICPAAWHNYFYEPIQYANGSAVEARSIILQIPTWGQFIQFGCFIGKFFLWYKYSDQNELNLMISKTNSLKTWWISEIIPPLYLKNYLRTLTLRKRSGKAQLSPISPNWVRTVYELSPTLYANWVLSPTVYVNWDCIKLMTGRPISSKWFIIY